MRELVKSPLGRDPALLLKQEGASMFSVNLSTRECDGHVVVAMGGELDLVDAADVAAALVTVAAREPEIIVDLAGLEFIDSSGVAALARARKLARHAGGDLLLAAPRQPVLRVLAVTRLVDDFSVHARHSTCSATAPGPATAARPTWPRHSSTALRPSLARPRAGPGSSYLSMDSRASSRASWCAGERGNRVCFSPQADVAGGLLICVIGVDAVRHIRQRREFIALAWIPVLLGAHQFIEALVWLWLQGHVPRGIGHVALWAYLLIAFVVLPVFVPLAVIAVEPTRRRKQMMAPFAALGAVIAVRLFAAMVRGPVGVKLAPYHLSYSIRLSDGFWIVALYVVAVCGPLLVSGYRNVALFGVVNLVAVIVIARLTVSGFASVWCGWAAVSSAAITLHCRFARPRPQRARPGPDGLISAG